MNKISKLLVMLCCLGFFLVLIGCGGGGGADEIIGANVINPVDNGSTTNELRTNKVTILYPSQDFLAGKDTPVVLSFSESVVDLTPAELKKLLTIKKKNDNAFMLVADSYELTDNNRVVRFSLQNLEYSTEYEVLVDAGIKAKEPDKVKDSEGGAFGFTTIGADGPKAALFKPAVTEYQTLPVENVKLSIAFTQSMAENAKYGVKLLTAGGVEVPLVYVWGFEHKILEVSPVQSLAYDSAYTLAIDKELAKSNTGLPIEDFTPVNLETIGFAKASLIIPDELTNVSVDTNKLVISFDEDIDWTSADNNKIVLAYWDDEWVNMNHEPYVTIEREDRKCSFKFESSSQPKSQLANKRASVGMPPRSYYLSYETKFRITVKEGIKTKSLKKPYVEPVAWIFTTEEYPYSPR